MAKSMHETPFDAVKTGRVSSINREKATARVYFEDLDVVSNDLKVVPFQTMKTKSYWMPSIDEMVVCLFADGPETGFVIGSPYSEIDKPPAEVKDKDCVGVWFEDGTVIKYELDTKTLTLDCAGEINILAKQPINIKAESDMFLDGTLHVTKDVIVNGAVTTGETQ